MQLIVVFPGAVLGQVNFLKDTLRKVTGEVIQNPSLTLPTRITHQPLCNLKVTIALCNSKRCLALWSDENERTEVCK